MMIRSLALVTAILLVCVPLQAADLTHSGLDEGYFDMYNLDFAGAHQVFAGWSAAHADDPLGPASDAAAYLFSEFDRLGVLDVELFADEDRFTGRGKTEADPKVREAFEQRVSQADKLASQALTKNPTDARALYTETLIAGLHADYAAMIDKKDYAALKYTEQGSALAQKTIAADPNLYDARIAMGVENYMLSLKPAAMRFFLLLRGDHMSKEDGIREMRLTAEKGHYLAPFARLMLAVAELKDKHPGEARDLLVQLAKDFPRNTLYARQIARIH